MDLGAGLGILRAWGVVCRAGGSLPGASPKKWASGKPTKAPGPYSTTRISDMSLVTMDVKMEASATRHWHSSCCFDFPKP